MAEKTGMYRVIETATGEEIWCVDRDGIQYTLVTSRTSMAAIGEASVKYAGALERLAKK